MDFRPLFIQQLANPAIQTVLCVGCGGGYDFVHSLFILPFLRASGKRVVFGSYSFGNVDAIRDAETFWEKADGFPRAKLVCAKSTGSLDYQPEILLARFMDAKFPESSPHDCIAFNARDFCVPTLTALYTKICDDFNVDAIVVIDGGSDGLMKGDEAGVGDLVEDAVSIASVASLPQRSQHFLRLLLVAGMGCDRANEVSDAASLRAVAELTASGHFQGCISISNEIAGLYRECMAYMNDNHSFRSIVSHAILASVDGYFGSSHTPAPLMRRVQPGDLFIWPVMSFLFGFDLSGVYARSWAARVITDAPSFREASRLLDKARYDLRSQKLLLGEEYLPVTGLARVREAQYAEGREVEHSSASTGAPHTSTEKSAWPRADSCSQC